MPRLLDGLSLVVFDFDGVILESADIKTEAFVELFADHPEHQDAILAHHLAHEGISRYKKFEWIHAQLLGAPLSEGESARLGARFSELVLSKVLAAPMVPGALPLLECLSRRMPLAIASGTPESELRSIVEQRQLAQYFTAVRGTPDTKPQILREQIAAHDLTPQDVLMIGDAQSDFRAAQEVGTRFFARGASGRHDWLPDGQCWSEDLSQLVQAFD